MREGWQIVENVASLYGYSISLEDIPGFSGVPTRESVNISSSLPQFEIDVLQNASGSITLTWSAPMLNDDGSALTDLAAYKFYYGTSPGSYSNQVRVDSPGITTYVLDNLTPATYYIAATAVKSNGVESSFSNEAVKQVL